MDAFRFAVDTVRFLVESLIGWLGIALVVMLLAIAGFFLVLASLGIILVSKLDGVSLTWDESFNEALDALRH